MKRIFNLLLVFATLSLVATSCKDIIGYYAGEPEVEGCYGVYFPTQEATGDHTFDPTMEPSVDFTVARTNSKGAITVPVTVTTSEEGAFEVGTLSFVDGQSETTLTVNFDNTKMGTKYSISIGIEDPQYASKYSEGATNIDFSVLRVQWIDFLDPKTNQPAVITFNEGWWEDVHTATLKYYEVDGVRTCVATCNEGNGIWGDAVGVDFEFIWHTETNLIDVPKQYFGFDYSDWASKPEGQAAQPIYFYDWYNYLTIDGGYAGSWTGPDDFYARNGASFPRSYYDGNGGFYFNLTYQIPGLGGWTPDTFDVLAIASGFTRVDYSIELVTDYCTDGYTPIYLYAGADVKSIKYAIYEGELTATQVANKVEGIIGGSEPTTTFSDIAYYESIGMYAGAFGVAPKKTGIYTLVAVAHDKDGKAQAPSGSDVNSVTFNYIAKEDEGTYAVNVNVGTEPVSERYEHLGYNDINSIAFYVYGEDLIEAHILTVKTSEYEKDVEGWMSEVKYAEPVSEEVLAEINAPGGYTGLVSGLSPLTDYTILVWATNGDLETVVTASRTTDGLPLEEICTGSYIYRQFFEGEDKGLSLFKDPNIPGSYQISQWGGGVDFKFTMDENGVINVPMQLIGYTHPTYGPVYVLESADCWTDAYLQENPAYAEKSYYDAKTGTYYFNVAYIVQAGVFGCGWEMFSPDAAGASVSTAANGVKDIVSKDIIRRIGFNLPSKDIRIERNPQAVEVKTSALEIVRKNDSSKDATPSKHVISVK